MKRKQMVRLFLLPLFLCCLMATLIVLSGAETAVEKRGSMIEIENSLAEHRLGEVKRVENDGYIGIPVQFSLLKEFLFPLAK